jgi:hypothetical protein
MELNANHRVGAMLHRHDLAIVARAWRSRAATPATRGGRSRANGSAAQSGAGSPVKIRAIVHDGRRPAVPRTPGAHDVAQRRADALVPEQTPRIGVVGPQAPHQIG